MILLAEQKNKTSSESLPIAMSGKILVVEDDKHISKLVRYNLEKAGYECTLVITGEEVFETLEQSHVDLIVLDIMLPKMNGFEVCKQIRQNSRYENIPIIMLTAKGEEVDRVVGFELGADDYIVKPFSPRELALRVKAILKRGKSKKESPKDILEADIIKVDIPRHKVTVSQKEIKLTSMEFKLLTTLLSRRGRVQSRDQLLNDVWDLAADVTTRTIDTHVKRLRQKLGRAGRSIETVRGYGYRFKDEEE
ncbi:MAG TPA: response regulator transcription factor [Candidatus Omnitrophota bacterium]|nr:response regulator transcription factor [Candidatus Omnitrophota bacterium]